MILSIYQFIICGGLSSKSKVSKGSALRSRLGGFILCFKAISTQLWHFKSFPIICKSKQFDKCWVQNAQKQTVNLGLGFRWNFFWKRKKLLSLLIRFWDREPSSLSSHAWISFDIWISFIQISNVKLT